LSLFDQFGTLPYKPIQKRTVTRPTEQLINEIRLLYQSLVLIGDEIHAGSDISMGMRAVLEYLDRNGDTTVPHIARSRRVTRQRIQTLVNALLQLELVAIIDNPASKRSPLIGLSKSGRKTILEMRKREGRELQIDICEQKILDATDTLVQIRDALEKSPVLCELRGKQL
jgi:DNA-binding MarR family transcriptional regulator